jgi:arsenate reductase
MRELGLDLAGRVPHRLDHDDAAWAQVVVTMGCGDACPVVPGTQYLDWQLEDPHGLGIDGVRAVRDQVERHVTELAARLHDSGSETADQPSGWAIPTSTPSGPRT